MAIVTELSFDDNANSTFLKPSHTKRWQQAALQVAEQMHQAQTGDRLTKALNLVLTHAVTLNADGTATVKSGERAYRINGQCPCEDARRRTLWCKHKLAAEIHKRATALLQETPYADDQQPHREIPVPQTPGLTARQNEHHPLSISTEPLPQSTCCIKDVIGTREISWTLRGDDEAVSRRVQRVLSFLDKLKEHMSKPEPDRRNDRDTNQI
jgi:hypothetical protein